MAATETETIRGPHAGLIEWLAKHGVGYEVHEHALTFTAREAARAEGVDPVTFAKTLGVVTADGRRALLVLEATDHLDLVKARRALDSGHVRLLTEAELLEMAPDCAVGTMPPIGEFYDVSVVADHALAADAQISFHAGSHRFAVRVDRMAWEREAVVRYADLAENIDSRPLWARS